MKPFKEPVIYRFENLSFELDIKTQVLRQTNDSSHEISFIDDMTDHSDHYMMAFDKVRKRVADQTSAADDIEPLIMPTMVQLDPEGMAAAFGQHLADVIGKTDFEVIVNQEQLAKRHQGVLPIIHIAEQPYIVDLRLKELRHLTDLSRSINLNKFALTSEGDEYSFFYDSAKHEPVALDPKLTEFPDHVVLAKIPNEIGLDPVATAATYGIDERKLLRRFPIKDTLHARLIPLADTGVPGLINRNRETLRQEHQQIIQTHKPRRGQRI